MIRRPSGGRQPVDLDRQLASRSFKSGRFHRADRVGVARDISEVCPGRGDDHDRGQFAFDLQVRAVSHDGCEFGPCAVPISERIESEIDWSPEDLFLVAESRQTNLPDEIVVRSRSGAPCEIAEIVACPEFLEYQIAPAQDGAVAASTLRVSARNGFTARGHGTIVVRVRSGADVDVKIPIPVLVQPIVQEGSLTTTNVYE